jgi:serine/threonine protein kinase
LFQDKKEYAVKILHTFQDDELIGEIAIQKSLNHPNIVRLYDSFTSSINEDCMRSFSLILKVFYHYYFILLKFRVLLI